MQALILRIIAIPVLVFTSLSALQSQCEYQLNMFDSFGDGWNGGNVTITSGSETYTFTLNEITDNGTDSIVYFTVIENEPLTISWSSPGIFDYEVSFQVFDFNGDLVYDIVEPPMGVLFTGTGMCPSCLKPSDITINNIWDTRMRASWTAYNVDINTSWLVIYGPPGFDLAAGEGDTVTVLAPDIMLTDLEKKTEYEFYIVQDCGMDDYSAAAGPVLFETYWTNDVGIADVIAPLSGCDLGEDSVTIVLKNYGSAPQSFVYFRYYVNGQDAGVGQPDDGVWTDVIGKDSCEVITFETTFDFSAPGEYLITVFTEMDPIFGIVDEDMSNDTFHYRIVNRLQPSYEQEFEEWGGGWYVDTINSVASSWELGMPDAPVINEAASGQFAWVTNLDGTHNTNELSYLNSPCFDFSDASDDPVIEFSINHNTEGFFDGAFLEMSVDGGEVWERVGELGTGFNWYNEFNSSANLGDVWSGNSNGWITARHRLFATAGESEVLLRFGMGSGPFFNLEGVGVDDIRIYVPFVNDLAALNVSTSGENTDCGLENDEVIFTFSNFGANPQGIFPIFYSVNGGPPVQDVVGNIITPDEQQTFNFSIPFDSRDGEFEIKVWTGLATDQDKTNDTITYFVSHLPRPVPFFEDFEEGILPDGWSSNGFVTNGSNNQSFVLEYNLYAFLPNFEHTLPRYGVISTGDSLRFDYRITDFIGNGTVATTLGPNDMIEVLISTDCGMIYTPLYVITDTTHTPSVDLQTVVLDLSDYADESISIQFRGTWGSGDYFFDLDNVNLQACPQSMGLTAQTTASDPGMANGSATVTVGLGTPPYSYEWSDGQTTSTATGLDTGIHTVTVTDGNGCIDILVVSIGNTAAGEISALEQFVLRPNPTTGTAWLNLRFSEPVDVQVQLLDLLGRVIMEQNNSNSTQVNEMLELGSQPDGMYMLRVVVDDQVRTERLIKSN